MGILSDWQESTVSTFLEELEGASTVSDLVCLGRFMVAVKDEAWHIRSCWKKFQDKTKDLPKRLYLLLDLSNIYHRCWFVSRGAKDTPESSLRYTQSIISEFRKAIPIVAADCGPTWRHRAFPEYKGDRPEKPPEFNEYRKKFEDLLAENGLAPVSYQDHEADDVIATAVTTAAVLGSKSVIAVDDRDMWQLLSENTVMWTKKGGFYNRAKLKEEHLIEPSQAVDWLCLVGKDCVPSCKGVGEKKASKILSECGDYLTAVDYCRDGRTIEKSDALLEYQDDYLLAWRLHSLKKNLDIDWSWE